jgi:acyl-CoA synthetase (AMP-forming)/AMP-acid ligase II
MITSPFALLRFAATLHPARVAIEDGDRCLTYEELHENTLSKAAELASAGIGRGDRVAIHLRKSLEEVVATLAISALGAVFVNVNYQWTARQALHIAKDCAASLLLTDSRRVEPLREALGELAMPVIEFTLDAEREGLRQVLTCHSSISGDLAALLYTSGSTGAPKGVMVTNRNLLDGGRIVAEYLGLVSDDRILSVPPFSFDYGLNQLISALEAGCTLVLHKVPMATEIRSALSNRKISVLPLVSPSWVQIIRLLKDSGDSVPTLRVATNTGGRIPREDLRHVPELFPGAQFFLMYGLTEAFRSTYLPPHLFESKLGALGIAVPDNEIFVVDPERGLCGPGEQGELLHRGSLVSRGYWGRPDLTRERIRPNPHLAGLIGDEPLVHSGDLVRLDADGILWFVGRSDDMIKCSGYRISPTEIEDVLAACAGVNESMAFGFDDDMLGQVVFLVCAGSADGEAILAYCRRELPSYMVPARIFPWQGAFPRTSSGKVDRQAVRKETLTSMEMVVT